MGTRDLEDRRKVTWHSKLVDGKDCLRVRRDRRIELSHVHVERIELDVYEYRHRTAVANRVRRRDKRVAHRDDLVSRADTTREERKVQRCRAAGYRAGVRRADGSRELALEGGHLRPLSDPA